MKFIHTADIHLGAAPDSGMPWAADRGSELWETFYRLLDKAEKSNVELLLIAGDLFHRQPLKRELKELNYRFSQLTHTRIVIVAGNHDYIGTQSFYKDFEWADNVVFFRKNHISYVYIASLNLVVYGMSYDRQEITEAMYDQLRPMRRLKDGRPLPEGCRHILLAHGGDSRHIPINQDKLRQAGFDYVALGHIHSPQHVGRETVRYCGTPLKYSFSEAGQEKSVTVVELKEKGDVSISTIPLRPLRDLRKIKGTYLEVTSRDFYAQTNTSDYLQITLTDEEDILDGLQKLRIIYPNLMQLEYDNQRTRENQEILQVQAMEEKSELELFEEFYQLQNNQPMSEEQKEFTGRLIQKLKEEGQ